MNHFFIPMDLEFPCSCTRIEFEIHDLKVPVIVMQRVGVMAQPTAYVETVVHERLKSVRITWNHAGRDVSIVGSWNNWETTEALQRVGQQFVIVKTLPISIYQYRFIVDGYFTHAPDFPSHLHHSGYVYNILDLQDYIPVARSDTEEPSSPPSSYDNILLNEDEFNRPPPELPPQLPMSIRQEEASTSNSDQVATNMITHLELNHLYMHRSEGDQFVALRSTNRFQHKYITTVLYKSLH
ncbi:SNF1-related protein kinase regulatory subunit beta-2-like isoform X2 [Cicer arietinum]|uniref:SNF1-related protein kinase regulatory subunit beta-2-like isoform X2 n=1 Tax=Cicer arietinum TaxID=3827 RepID=A0A3Q7XVE3_CICAR|nr:SNF1-related protein kinase regulatory subunit beta-2-like isoform X2 [Cicer arietinum]